MSTLELKIYEKALALGYEACGMVPIGALEGFNDRLHERMQKVQGGEVFYQNQLRLAKPLETFPWAKGVIVLAWPLTQYQVPNSLNGKIGKHYLLDVRLDSHTTAFKHRRIFENYLKSLGLTAVTHDKFGLVGLRWAAMVAGLGVVRKNNFLYTASGSFVHLEAWLIDRPLEHILEPELPECPEGCNLCVKACPTSSLSEPYTMNPLTCISYLTTFGGRRLHEEPLASKFGDCIYGCDLCQSICPKNKDKWRGTEVFGGLEALEAVLKPEAILQMSEAYYRDVIQPKFFYLAPDELWKWQVNALNYLKYNDQEAFLSAAVVAKESPYEAVRAMVMDINA